MAGYQPEDNLLPECIDCLRGFRPRHAVWKKYAYPESSRDVGSSPNWYAMAAGVAACQGDRDAIERLRDVLSEPNDHGQQEAMTDDSHWRFRVTGWYTARVGARKKKDANLAGLLTEHIRQSWAMALRHATDPLDPPHTFIVAPGQRAADPKTAKSLLEYLWLRGCGLSHARIRALPAQGRSMARQAERVYRNQEDFTCREFADRVETDLKIDVAAILAGFRSDGWPGVDRFILRGTRGSFHSARYGDHGYVGVQERDFGTDNPRLVVIARSSSALPAQFPATDQPRRNTACWANFDVERGLVTAYDSVAGTFAGQAPTDPLVSHLYIGPTGVADLTEQSLAGMRAAPDPVPPGAGEILPPRLSWWQRLWRRWTA